MKNRWMIPSLLAGTAFQAFAEEAAEVVATMPDLGPVTAQAAEGIKLAGEALFTANNVWMLVSTVLVFIMHLGFATLEAGLTRAKNTVNILFKNVMVVSIGFLTYALWGFNIMYPGEAGEGGFFVLPSMLGIGLPEGYTPIGYADGAYTYWTDFIFQAAFAATAATIVSGAVAERIKLSAFLIFTVLYVGIAYPVVGMWKWGGGWLDAAGFVDFAGSTLVHSVGGWGALAGALLLGPRIGKYVRGQVRPIFGHNLPLATIGMFLLWFGWYGFNGGSVLSGDPEGVSLVFVTTSLGAAAGIVGALIASIVFSRSPDLSMVLNGALAGLVGITASADIITPLESVIIGGIAGVLVYFSVLFFDKIKIDDPVGAISVHLVCGIWGTLATGIWGEGASFVAQLKGVLGYAAFCLPFALAVFGILRVSMGIRVSREEELGGLDKGEHNSEAYAGFNILN